MKNRKFQQSQLTHLRKLSLSDWLLEILKYTLIVILAVSFILPFYGMLSSSVKNDAQVYTVPPIWFPNPQHWTNFWAAWTSENFKLFTYNTVVRYAVPATIGTVLSSSLVAYSLYILCKFSDNQHKNIHLAQALYVA